MSGEYNLIDKTYTKGVKSVIVNIRNYNPSKRSMTEWIRMGGSGKRGKMTDKQSLQREKRRQMMLEEKMIKVIPKVAIPMIISTLIDSIYNLADTFFVSQLGKNATAAVAVNDSLMNILRAISMGFAIGASSYISRLMGAKEDDRASKVASTTLITGCVFSLVFGVTCFFFRSPIVDILGVTESAKRYSMDYATYILLAAPFTTANLIMNQLLRSEGSTTFAMWGMVSGCVLNIILDPIFINVLGLEVAGAAMATALSKIFSCMVLAIPFIKKKAMLELKVRHFSFTKDVMFEVGRMGVPSFIRMSLMSVGGIITNNVAKGFGTSVLAAISVANKLNRFISSAIMGFSQGFGPVAGFCWGAKKYTRVREAFRTTAMIGCTCALIIGGSMFVFAEPLINVFNSEADIMITTMGAFKVRTLCIALIPHVLVMVTSNLYQSLGLPLGNLILSMSRQLLVLIPIVLVLPRHFGEYGLAGAQALSDIISFLLLALPLLINLMNKIKKLNDGEDAPFGAVSAKHK